MHSPTHWTLDQTPGGGRLRIPQEWQLFWYQKKHGRKPAARTNVQRPEKMHSATSFTITEWLGAAKAKELRSVSVSLLHISHINDFLCTHWPRLGHIQCINITRFQFILQCADLQISNTDAGCSWRWTISITDTRSECDLSTLNLLELCTVSTLWFYAFACCSLLYSSVFD